MVAEDYMRAWFYLLFAILLEVAGITSMKLSDGFTRLEPSLFIFVFYVLSFGFLALTLKRIELGVAYAIWSALGTLLIVLIGVCAFGETLTLLKGFFLGCIILGVMGLRQV